MSSVLNSAEILNLASFMKAGGKEVLHAYVNGDEFKFKWVDKAWELWEALTKSK